MVALDPVPTHAVAPGAVIPMVRGLIWTVTKSRPRLLYYTERMVMLRDRGRSLISADLLGEMTARCTCLGLDVRQLD